MSDDTLPRPANVVRMVFKEILEGDRRKFEAQSNDSETGGGARDLRFSPYEKFKLVFEKMLPDKDAHGVCTGYFTWIEGGLQQRVEGYFHPPTKARPTEGRIANVDKYLPTKSLPPHGAGNVVLLIVQQDDGSVWPHFITDRSLETEDWHPRVRELILGCLHARRREGVSMAGFVDFESGEEFCNGK